MSTSRSVTSASVLTESAGAGVGQGRDAERQPADQGGDWDRPPASGRRPASGAAGPGTLVIEQVEPTGRRCVRIQRTASRAAGAGKRSTSSTSPPPACRRAFRRLVSSWMAGPGWHSGSRLSDRQVDQQDAVRLTGSRAPTGIELRGRDRPGVAAADKQLAQAAGDRRQQQIVHLHAEPVAGRAQVLQRGFARSPTAVGRRAARTAR